MSIVSAVTGRAFSTTLYLPQAAVGPVQWAVRDNHGKIVLKGQVPPASNTVIIQGVLPSGVCVPPDGSRFSLTATDGTSSAVEYFEVISPVEVTPQSGEIAYMCGRPFTDALILPRYASCVSVQIFVPCAPPPLGPGQSFVIPDECISRRGDAYVYSFSFASTPQGLGTLPPGVLNTNTSGSFGNGSVVWDYTFDDSFEEGQEVHPYYTVTPHTLQFITGIQRQVDKARIGDVNNYLAYTPADLAHSFARGCDYVMQSPPVSGGWALDATPVMLKDYIVKAGALDILRAQYQAEGMSQFDLQGMRTQLTVDRTQYLGAEIDRIEGELAGLLQAKNMWMAQGSPMGNQISGGKRPIGILGLSRGTYSPWPMVPLPVISGGYSWAGGGTGWGPLY